MRTPFSPTRHFTFLRGAAAVAFSAAAIGTTPMIASAQTVSIPANAKYACNFENSYCDFHEQSKAGSFSPGSSGARRSSLVTTSRVGGYGVRLRTEPGDDNVNGSGAWERNDLQKPADSGYCNEGQEEWWAVSVLFPSDYVMPASGQGGVIVDFHHTGSSGVPNFGVEVRGESGMRISGYGGSVNGGQYRAQIADPWGAVNNVTRNVWYDFVFHIKWSAGSGGFAEAWLNGKKVLTHAGATLYTGQSCYLKLANYHAPSGKASSTIFDRVVRGTSAADVAITALEGVDGFFAPSTPPPPVTTTGTSTGSNPSTGGTGTATGSTGRAAASATMDSSAYNTAAGQRVTFTARLLGNGATPGGTVAFAADGNAIAGCGSVAVSGGLARCTTSALAGGQHRVTGAYSGDSTYAAAQAGPITQTVTGSLAAPQALPVKFGMGSSRYTITAGDSVTFTASVPGSGGSVRFSANGSTIASCSAVAVSSAGLATCTTSALASGAHAISGAYSGNGSYRAGTAGPITQTVNAKSSLQTSGALNVQGLWWGGAAESGWGVNLAQQGGVVFATWFTYDAQGNASWLVMSDGRATGANSYSGTVYRTSGPAFAAGFDPSRVTRTAVGSATFNFRDSDHGTFSAVIDGVQVARNITRQVFDARVPSCSAGGNASATRNFQDLWWRAGGAESGWGLNLAHQGDKLFLTWFTYAEDGTPLWLVASDVARQADGSYAGTLYRTTGTALARAWDPGRASVTAVGSVRFSFSDGANGTFAYTVDGTSGSKPITRQAFSTPATVCTAA